MAKLNAYDLGHSPLYDPIFAMKDAHVADETGCACGNDPYFVQFDKVDQKGNPWNFEIPGKGNFKIADEMFRDLKARYDKLMEHGHLPWLSCNPYFNTRIPEMGEYAASSESIAAAYINTILGARANRESPVNTVYGAYTGCLPKYGTHLDENRAAKCIVELDDEVREIARLVKGRKVKEGVQLWVQTDTPSYFMAQHYGDTKSIEDAGGKIYHQTCMAMTPFRHYPKTITSALEELGVELDISESDFGGKLKIEGKDPVVASRHHIGESTSVLLALFGMELAAIWRQRAGSSQDVKVSVHNAVCNLAAVLYAKHNGVTIPFDDVGLVETTDFFRCKDSRWVFIVCSLPRLRQLACAVLDCQATQEAFSDRCLRWNAAELEEAMSAVGACNATRTDPFRVRQVNAENMVEELDRSGDLIAKLAAEKIEAVISIVGPQALSLLFRLHRQGLRTVCIPTSVENDVAVTQLSFGFNSALSFAVDTTASGREEDLS